ncbi:MAG: SGNH/GDSL hydrolase family protein [Planctomycetota bacterium]
MARSIARHAVRSSVWKWSLPLLVFAWTHAAASPYTGLVVFGDSLSDVGNTSASTFGLQPGSAYFDGRFSNGPVYAERLADGLGLDPVVRSGAGGRNYAFGGAETNGPGGFVGLFLDSLVEQVDDYVGGIGGADPNALHVVFIGANDLFNGQSSVATPLSVISTQLDRLVDAGARQVLGINLPLLGLTPDNLGNAGLSAATAGFNAGLATLYDTLETATPGLTIHRLDVATLFSRLVAAPSAWGFTNTTSQGINAADAAGFVFWDGVHPTREAHALLGEAAIRAVLPEGDYDRDGVVTTADYAVWRAEYGNRFDAAAGVTTGFASDANNDGRIDAADYTVWRDAFALAAVAIPEPGGLLLGLALVGTGLVGSSPARGRFGSHSRCDVV